MTWPGDWMTVTGRGHLLAADADREQVIDTLKAGFVQGRLTKDEFELRVGQAVGSRTYAHLAAVTADLPVSRMAAPPLARTAHRHATQPAGSDLRATVRVAVAAIILAVVLWLGTCFPVDAALLG